VAVHTVGLRSIPSRRRFLTGIYSKTSPLAGFSPGFIQKQVLSLVFRGSGVFWIRRNFFFLNEKPVGLLTPA
jgi:hypothetical protein